MTLIWVNGRRRDLPEGRHGTLLAWLRSTLGLTGAKPGCGEGACGACTVLLDGEAVLSCQVPLAAAGGASVTTVEGLASGGWLHPVQQALVQERAAQCGYCMPGVTLRAVALLDGDPDPAPERVKEALGPSLCRCGCYPAILRAIDRAARLARGEEAGDRMPVSYAGTPPARRRVRRPWDLCQPEARDYFDVLGPGLMFVWPPEEPLHGGLADDSAWMHLAPDGAVTAFSGKVDVGQGNTTAFRVLVAEEMDVDLPRVSMVQGDTDVCPFDIGTFGSRSLPDSGEPLRRAAAGARQFLLSEASALWKVPRARLATTAGSVADGVSGNVVTYADIAAGRRELVVLSGDPGLLPAARRRLVGRPGHGSLRPEAVTGDLRFGSDRTLPGTLHAAVLHPPAPGSLLESVEASEAEAMPGVTVVRAGGLVATLAAGMPEARAALATVKARWREPASPTADLETHLRSHPSAGDGWERPIEDITGDVEVALAATDTRFGATYTTAFLAHIPLETSCALAAWGPDGRVTCEVGTQTPFLARRQVANACGVGEEAVRIVVPPTGGAYGGKHGGDTAVEAAILARASGRPVRVQRSRGEELTVGYLRPMAVIDIRAALDSGGVIAAWDHLVVNGGPAGLSTPYVTGVRRLRSQPASSPVRQGSYRALGANANNFARECAMDELAFSAGVDPLEFRIGHLDDDRLVEVLRRATARFGSTGGSSSRDGRRTGSGLAVGVEKGGRVATWVEVEVDQAGHVEPLRLVTAYECGAIVDPDAVSSQVEGATVMALGGALREAVPVVGGHVAVAGLSGYPVPRFADLPHIEVVLVGRPDLPSAGAGETPMIAVAPALANAIFAATGTRRRHLPLDPPVGVAPPPMYEPRPDQSPNPLPVKRAAAVD